LVIVFNESLLTKFWWTNKF